MDECLKKRLLHVLAIAFVNPMHELVVSVYEHDSMHNKLIIFLI